MVQKNQYTYNVPPGPSDYIYNEAQRAEFNKYSLMDDNESKQCFSYVCSLLQKSSGHLL